MRDPKQVVRFQQEAQQRLERLSSEEKRASKDKSARGRLALFDLQLQRLSAQESLLGLEREAAELKVKALEEQYEAAVATEGVALDGTAPPGSAQAPLAAQLQRARAEFDSKPWGNRLRGLAQAKRNLEAEKARFATENYDQLLDELAARGRQVGNEFQNVNQFHSDSRRTLARAGGGLPGAGAGGRPERYGQARRAALPGPAE